MKAIPALALALLAAGCHKAVADPAGVPVPAGEVWLSAAELQGAKIEVAAVQEQNVDDTIVTSGRVTLDDLRSGHVFSPVSGRVVRIDAALGQRVKKGEALARIESPDIGSAVSDMHKGQADLIAAQHDYERKKDLFEQKAASAADVEIAEDTYRKARAEVERARQKAYLLRAGNVDMVSQTYTVTAPLDGEVLLRAISPGVEVQGQYGGGSTPELFTIGEVDQVWVLGDLYETDLGRVRVGSTATVTVVTYPGKVFKGTVDWVSGMLDPGTRTAKVRCTFQNPDKLLRPEMYATMQIAVDQKRALAIPRASLIRLGEYQLVFLEVGEASGVTKFARVPVDVEDTEGSPWLTVKHGLEPGQKIVVAGVAPISQKL